MLQQRLQQKLQQKLSPLQIQMIKMLEVPTIELEDRIKQEIDANPALEEDCGAHEEEGMDESYEKDGSKEAEQESDVAEEEEYGGGDEYEKGYDESREDDYDDYVEDPRTYDRYEGGQEIEDYKQQGAAAQSTLHEVLMQQLSEQKTDEEIRTLSEIVIGNIDTNGYLQRTAEFMADDYAFQTGKETTPDKFEKAINLVKQFDPAGVGAQSLQECLLLQLQRRETSESVENAKRIVSDEFLRFSQGQRGEIAKRLGLTISQEREAEAEITRLNPKPGSVWENTIESVAATVLPDFTVENDEGKLIVYLNNDHIPPLRVSREFAEMYDSYSKNPEKKNKEERDAILFVKQKIDSAKWFIDSIKQRNETLLCTMNAIVARQRSFFLDGDECKLVPMILKDIADATGYDISTVSRVSNSKYVQTEFGVYPLKFFFVSSVQNTDGEDVSNNNLKVMIYELIEAEDKSNPLTDDQLTKQLNERGLAIARRTVAKYREQLGIEKAGIRKAKEGIR